MAIDLYRWGTRQRVYFKLTLNGVGQAGLTLQANDVKIKTIIAGVGSWVNASTVGAITDEGNGWYSWYPNAMSNTQCEEMLFSIKDDSAGGEFDENALVVITGGDVAARLDGV